MNIKLYKLDKGLKNILVAFIITLSLGVITGLIYLNYTTNMTPDGAVTRFNGSEPPEDEFEIRENYPKPLPEMLLTTHNHVIAFSLIFILLGTIFYFNSIVGGFWKKFLVIEPFISTIVSFGSIWLVRFVHEAFVYLTVISAVLIYLSFFIMAAIALYELMFKKEIPAT